MGSHLIDDIEYALVSTVMTIWRFKYHNNILFRHFETIVQGYGATIVAVAALRVDT
jgi:hypothetical protein